MARRILTASQARIKRLREVMNEEVVTRRKHLLITSIATFAIFGLIMVQVNQLQSSTRDADLRSQAADMYRGELRSFDNETVAYEQCLAVVENRELARAENERDSQVLVDIVAAVGRFSGAKADNVIAELYSVIEAGRQAADDARPSFPTDFCPALPVEPIPPD